MTSTKEFNVTMMEFAEANKVVNIYHCSYCLENMRQAEKATNARVLVDKAWHAIGVSYITN
jgi:hypothetical protein